ncbi:hypothetical protein D3C80_1745160 [compost metagenome]
MLQTIFNQRQADRKSVSFAPVGLQRLNSNLQLAPGTAGGECGSCYISFRCKTYEACPFHHKVFSIPPKKAGNHSLPKLHKAL